MAAKVEVFEQEVVLIAELFAIAHVVRLSLSADNDFEIHDAASLCFLHLQGPDIVTFSLRSLSKSLKTLAHLKLEGLSDEIQ